MSKFNTLLPEVFIFQERQYRSIIRFPYGIVGLRQHDTCCADLVLLSRSNENNLRVIGEKKSAHQKFIREAADFCANTSETLHEHSSSINDTTWVLPDGQVVPLFSPTKVPGTSSGVMYQVIAVTKIGTVSYYHGSLKISQRLRISLNHDYVSDYGMCWSLKDKRLSDKFPNMFFQTVESTHMSYNCQGINQTIAVTARGLDALLNVQNAH